MDAQTASQQLAEADKVPCLEGGIRDARELLELCLSAEIPAELGSEACAKPGCTPKAQLWVRREDAPKVMDLLRARWQSALEKEGVSPVAFEDTGEGEPPCPACGNTQPLVEGACSDCGLQLE